MFKFPDPVPVFPVLPVGFSTFMKLTAANEVEISVSGYEVRSPSQVYPLWEFNLTFEVLREQTLNAIKNTNSLNKGFNEFDELVGLFLATRGQYGRFYFDCPEDDSRLGQAIALGDGVTTTFTVVRTLGTFYTEPVGGVNQLQPIVVYLNNTPTGAYHIEDNTVVFDTAPGNSVAITMDFFFYYFCRFLEDVQDFEQFMRDLWTMRTLKFRSVKP